MRAGAPISEPSKLLKKSARVAREGRVIAIVEEDVANKSAVGL
jgi:hypothetical protein